ncbi:MAG: thioesterase family protein [Chitinophagaceae bacterium]|jgi:acyl-CoA thioesterase FadM|nr:thioesterase family protein [Chitinophagaceae bacterium]
MQKVKIEEPAKYHFSTEIPVRITDLNYGNHVGNDAFLGLVHEARVQYLKQYGYSELNVEGFGLIMSDAAIRFMAELFYGDVVKIEVAPFGFSSVGFDLIYRLSIIREEKQSVAGLAKTGMILFDYEKRRPVPLPDMLKNKMQLV